MEQKEPKSSSIINMTTTIIILTSNRELTMCQELQDNLYILSHWSWLHNYNISIMSLYFEDGRTNRDLQWLLIISWISASRISTFCPPLASWISSWPPGLLPLASMPLWKPLPLWSGPTTCFKVTEYSKGYSSLPQLCYLMWQIWRNLAGVMKSLNR